MDPITAAVASAAIGAVKNAVQNEAQRGTFTKDGIMNRLSGGGRALQDMFFSRKNPFGYTPSIVSKQIDLDSDVKRLNKAMKGFGTDEDEIIDVLCKRTAEQRLEIAKHYKETFNKDLTAQIKKETKGNLEKVLLNLLQKPESYDAEQLRNSIKGIGTNESTLIEILVSRTNSELQKIKKLYENRFDKSLEDDIKGDTTGKMEKVLLALAAGRRDESWGSNKSASESKAKELKKAGIATWGTDESKFIKILTETSYSQLAEVFDIYEDMTSEDFDESIKKEMGGDFKRCLLSITESVRNMPGFFSDKLKKAFSGIGTDDEDLIRIVITRTEKDLKSIADAYKKKYDKSLEDAIDSECGGDYKKALQTLVMGN